MRSVALSATVLLLWQPESLMEPGFQLSFAATVALIAGFGALEGHVMRERLPRWVLPLFTLVLSSVIAGAATAPFAAAAFNRFTDYGLVANLLTVPVMSLLMAAGAVAALLAPIGLAAPALWVMEIAARWILFVAHWIAGLDGAVTPIVAPGPWVLPLLTLAGCWLVLMGGRARALAVLPMALGLGLWAMAERPLLLVSSDGSLAGLHAAGGRALSAAKGAGFTAGNWLAKDGDLATQDEAFARSGFSGPKAARSFRLRPPSADCAAAQPCDRALTGVILTGKSPDLVAACAGADLVILAGYAPHKPPKGCHLIDRRLLQKTGALAFRPQPGGWQIIPAARVGRIWMGQTALPALPLLKPRS
ncbi:MAG: hypothetical protein RL472_1814 [Pseudomonadota bacterium]